MTDGYTVSRLAAADRLDVQAFYRSVGYVLPLEPDAVCFGARGPHDALVGVVRLVREHGVLVLRGMQVRPDVQRLGIGRALLTALVGTLTTDCYCLPYGHLEAYYRGFGFRACHPTAAPPHLVERLAAYRAGDPGILLMHRPTAP